MNGHLFPCIKTKEQYFLNCLHSWMRQTCDWFFDCAKACYKTCVVLSNYTDIAVALLHHYPTLKKAGLSKLGIRGGRGKTVLYPTAQSSHTQHRAQIYHQGLITSQVASNIKGFASTHNASLDQYILDYLPLPTQHHRSTTIWVSPRG